MSFVLLGLNKETGTAKLSPVKESQVFDKQFLCHINPNRSASGITE